MSLCFLTATIDNTSSVCQSENNFNTKPSNQSCSHQDNPTQDVYPLLLLGQLLLGIASVPIQPFGISYIDDHASKKNSPLYLGKTTRKAPGSVSPTEPSPLHQMSCAGFQFKMEHK